MNPLEVRAAEACCEACGQSDKALSPHWSGVVVDQLCAVVLDDVLAHLAAKAVA